MLSMKILNKFIHLQIYKHCATYVIKVASSPVIALSAILVLTSGNIKKNYHNRNLVSIVMLYIFFCIYVCSHNPVPCCNDCL